MHLNWENQAVFCSFFMLTRANAGPFIVFSCNHLFGRRHSKSGKKLEYFAYMAFKIVHLIRNRWSGSCAKQHRTRFGSVGHHIDLFDVIFVNYIPGNVHLPQVHYNLNLAIYLNWVHHIAVSWLVVMHCLLIRWIHQIMSNQWNSPQTAFIKHD